MSNQKTDVIFADGFIYKFKHENSPDFIIGRISVLTEKAIVFLKEHDKDGWVNLEIRLAKETKKPYIALDTFEPKKTNAVKEEPKPMPVKVKKAPLIVESEEDLPF